MVRDRDYLDALYYLKDTLTQRNIYYWKKKKTLSSDDSLERISRDKKSRGLVPRTAQTIVSGVLHRSVYRVRVPELFRLCI